VVAVLPNDIRGVRDTGQSIVVWVTERAALPNRRVVVFVGDRDCPRAIGVNDFFFVRTDTPRHAAERVVVDRGADITSALKAPDKRIALVDLPAFCVVTNTRFYVRATGLRPNRSSKSVERCRRRGRSARRCDCG